MLKRQIQVLVVDFLKDLLTLFWGRSRVVLEQGEPGLALFELASVCILRLELLPVSLLFLRVLLATFHAETIQEVQVVIQVTAGDQPCECLLALSVTLREEVGLVGAAVRI